MPTRKIADLPKRCRHPEHDPPGHIVLEDGIYEHECPACGATQTFDVSRPTMAVTGSSKFHIRHQFDARVKPERWVDEMCQRAARSRSIG